MMKRDDKRNTGNGVDYRFLKVFSFLLILSSTIFWSAPKQLKRGLSSASFESHGVRALGVRSDIRDGDDDGDSSSARSLTTPTTAASTDTKTKGTDGQPTTIKDDMEENDNSTVAYLTEQVQHVNTAYKALSETLTQRTQERDLVQTKLQTKMTKKEKLISKLQQEMKELEKKNIELMEAHSKTEPPANLRATIQQKEGMVAKLQKEVQEIEKGHQEEMEKKAIVDPPLDRAAPLKETEDVISKFQLKLVEIEQAQKEKTTIEKVEISLDSTATIASDIVSIHHLPRQSKVVVNLHPKARCPRPSLVGRLSGPALVRLDWSWSGTTTSTAASRMIGTYNVPVAGEYFLEIMIIHCDDFVYGIDRAFEDGGAFIMSKKLKGTNNQNPLTFDFQPVCIEDPFRGRVTAKDASVVVPVDNIAKSPVVEGFWKKSDKVKKVSSPVFTRFEPTLECYQARKANKLVLPSICHKKPGLDQFLNYEFEWSDSWKELSAPMLRQPSPATVCYAGYSHSRVLTEAASRVGLDQYNVTVHWVQSRYPVQLTMPRQINFMRNKKCSSLVIGVVQWPASYDGGRPTKLGQYYQDLTEMVLHVRKELPDMKLFFRAVHTTALMGTAVVCPSRDWRTPTSMSGYNKVIQQVCREHKIPFLDDTFLTAPVWDAPPDFSHLDERTSDVEILYLTASALGIIVDGKLKPNSSNPAPSNITTDINNAPAIPANSSLSSSHHTDQSLNRLLVYDIQISDDPRMHLKQANRASWEAPYLAETHYNNDTWPATSVFYGPGKPYFPKGADTRNESNLYFPTANATEAVCTLRTALTGSKEVPSRGTPLFNETAHNFQQLIRCFSWWQLEQNKGKQPVLYVEEYGNEKKHGDMSAIHAYYKAMVEVFGVRVDVEKRKSDTPTVLVDVPWTQMAWQNNTYVVQSPEHAKTLVKGMLDFYTPDNPDQGGCFSHEGQKRLKPVIAFLDRNDATRRKISNTAEILQTLRDAGYEDIIYQGSFAGMSLVEQIKFMSEVDILISPHGAQLTTSLYQPECGSLFELFPSQYWVPNWFGSLAAMRGNHHFIAYNGGFFSHKARLTEEYPVSAHAVEQVTHLMVQQWHTCCARSQEHQ